MTEKFAGKVKTYHVDQGNRDEVNEQFSTIIDDFGKIDVLINVAGVISAKSFDSLPPEEWDRTIKINLTGPYNTVHAIWQNFKANGGAESSMYPLLPARLAAACWALSPTLPLRPA